MSDPRRHCDDAVTFRSTSPSPLSSWNLPKEENNSRPIHCTMWANCPLQHFPSWGAHRCLRRPKLPFPKMPSLHAQGQIFALEHRRVSFRNSRPVKASCRPMMEPGKSIEEGTLRHSEENVEFHQQIFESAHVSSSCRYQRWRSGFPMAMRSRSPAGINSPALMANSLEPGTRDMGRWSEWRPVLAMLAVDVVFAVMNTMIKKAIDEGLNRLVLITLRQLVATLFMAPIAYFHERKTRPKLTMEICVYLFFSALLGAPLSQYLFYLGMQYTSATFACAFVNMAPVFTFLISLALRMESLNPKTKPGVAKTLGTLLCLIGVIVLTLYKGVALNGGASPRSTSPDATDNASRKWLMGSVALLAGSFCWSAWFPLQSKVGKKYPALYSGTALVFLLSFLQAAAMSLAAERSLSVWQLQKKMEIATVLFAGSMGSGLGFLTMSWCVEQRGPVFTAAFTPLVQVIVAGIDFAVLHEQIYLGSVLGSGLVIAGLYSLLWGKNKEPGSCAAKPAEGNGETQVQLQTV